MDENKRKQIKTPYDPDSISMSKLEQVQQEMKLLDSIFEYGDENYKVLVEVEYKLRQRTELLHRMKREYDEFELNKEAWEQFVIQCGGRWESNPRPSRPRPNSDEPDKENHPHINPKKDQPEKRSQIEFAWHVNKNEHFTLLGQEELLYFANRIYWQNTIIEEYYDTSADIDIRINKKDIYSLFVQSILDCIAPYTFELNILLNKMINTREYR